MDLSPFVAESVKLTDTWGLWELKPPLTTGLTWAQWQKLGRIWHLPSLEGQGFSKWLISGPAGEVVEKVQLLHHQGRCLACGFLTPRWFIKGHLWNVPRARWAICSECGPRSGFGDWIVKAIDDQGLGQLKGRMPEKWPIPWVGVLQAPLGKSYSARALWVLNAAIDIWQEVNEFSIGYLQLSPCFLRIALCHHWETDSWEGSWNQHWNQLGDFMFKMQTNPRPWRKFIWHFQTGIDWASLAPWLGIVSGVAESPGSFEQRCSAVPADKWFSIQQLARRIVCDTELLRRYLFENPSWSKKTIAGVERWSRSNEIKFPRQPPMG